MMQSLGSNRNTLLVFHAYGGYTINWMFTLSVSQGGGAAGGGVHFPFVHIKTSEQSLRF